MKLGFVSDSLGGRSFTKMLDAAVVLGVQGVEVNTGGWSAAPHFDMADMQHASNQKAFRKAFTDRNLQIIALNANGNPLHPTDPRGSACLKDTLRIAGAMGITTVCTMSGLPAGAAGDSMPNWVTNAWPPETQRMLAYQWDVALAYWHDMAVFAKGQGIQKIALELHANQLVFNVPGLLHLRDAIGPTIGANLDPSHLFWMGADPLAAATALGPAIYHVHAKDTFLNTPVQATRSLLETGSLTDIPNRAWSYITLGFGHDDAWWRAFCYHLLMAGYDGWLSIEHEDVLLNAYEGLQKSVDLLLRIMPSQPADFKLQNI